MTAFFACITSPQDCHLTVECKRHSTRNPGDASTAYALYPGGDYCHGGLPPVDADGWQTIHMGQGAVL